jgi:hypothetical protein
MRLMVSRPRSVGVVVAAIALAGAFAIWRLRRPLRRSAPRLAAKRIDVALREATQLYEALDSAMAAKGIARMPAMPPLKHARNLEALRHPLAKEVLFVTEKYLRARFGHQPLAPEEKREMEDRIRLVRAAEPPAPVARPAERPPSTASQKF